MACVSYMFDYILVFATHSSFSLSSDWCRSKFQQFRLLLKRVLEFWCIVCQIHISRITRIWIEKKKSVCCIRLLLASVLLMCLFSVVAFFFLSSTPLAHLFCCRFPFCHWHTMKTEHSALE